METKFRISGIERRQFKKELASKKSFLKHFWHYHRLDKDMCSFYGGREEYPMSDDRAQKRFDEVSREVEQMELMLKEKAP